LPEGADRWNAMRSSCTEMIEHTGRGTEVRSGAMLGTVTSRIVAHPGEVTPRRTRHSTRSRKRDTRGIRAVHEGRTK
jgi:hypothetical protein